MSFKDIKGQDNSIAILKECLRRGRLAKGYLFTGPEGVGKKLTAQTLAKTLNCQKNNFDSCDNCPSCLKIENNQHPDVRLLDMGDQEIKIEYIRQLQQNISLRPYAGKVKVFILNNAHHLNAEAQNALLKILEEPPKDSHIILVSSKPALLFKTVISRCRMIKFYPLRRTELEEILKKDYSLDNGFAHFLAYFCEGRLGRVFCLKDTNIFIEKNNIIDKFIFAKDANLENSSQQDRQDIRAQLNLLTTWFRDIYFLKIGMPHSELINLDRKQELLKSMSAYSFQELDGILNCICDSLLYLGQNINVKLLLSNLSEEINYGAGRSR